jgi:hypothetical protein
MMLVYQLCLVLEICILMYSTLSLITYLHNNPSNMTIFQSDLSCLVNIVSLSSLHRGVGDGEKVEQNVSWCCIRL